MKFYFASAFDLVPSVKRYVMAAESEGHTVTTKWWEGDLTAAAAKNTVPDGVFYSLPNTRVVHDRDFSGVESCEIFVIVTDGPTRKFNGAAVELGYALALGKRCYSIGRLPQSAMFLRVRQMRNVANLLNDMRFDP